MDAAEHMLVNQKDYQDGSLKNASLMVILHADYYSNKVLALAVKHIAANPSGYPEQFVGYAASVFIERNHSFFVAPSRSRSEFLRVFDSINKNNIIQLYSDKLTAVLCATRNQIKIQISDDKSTEKEYARGSIFAARVFHKFDEALNANEKIAIFILEHAGHEAITLWNFRKQ